jgi:hypothetical protein
MKRDMDLIRLLLNRLEEDQDLEVPGYDQKQILYHLQLMNDAGFVIADFLPGQDGEPVGVRVERLTNVGHDFIDSARNETVWAKFKDKSKKSGGMALDVAMEVLKGLAKQYFLGEGS